MKKNQLLFIVVSLELFSCGKLSESKTAILSKDKEVSKTSYVAENKINTEISNDKNIDTTYEYVDVSGKSVIIQNALPRGGTKYTSPKGEVYAYAIFWTRIINETDNPLELKIDFLDSYEVPSFPGKYFKILIPPDKVTSAKEDLFNYGLTDLDSFLDNNIDKPSSFKSTINPKDSSGFYVVKLGLVSEGPRGGGDILRTGLSLKGQDLFYRVSVYNSIAPPSIISEEEIDCGKINLKKLELRK